MKHSELLPLLGLWGETRLFGAKCWHEIFWYKSKCSYSLAIRTIPTSCPVVLKRELASTSSVFHPGPCCHVPLPYTMHSFLYHPSVVHRTAHFMMTVYPPPAPRNIFLWIFIQKETSIWGQLPFACPPLPHLGMGPISRACALTSNWTGFRRPLGALDDAPTIWATEARVFSHPFQIEGGLYSDQELQGSHRDVVTCKWIILRESHAGLVSIYIHSAKKMHTVLGCGMGGRVGILSSGWQRVWGERKPYSSLGWEGCSSSPCYLVKGMEINMISGQGILLRNGLRSPHGFLFLFKRASTFGIFIFCLMSPMK